MKTPFFAVVAIVLMSVAAGFVDLRTRPYPTRSYEEFIPRVFDGTADAPERYRVLVPFAVVGLGRVTGLTPAYAWHLSLLVLFLAAYFVFFHYLRTWFSPVLSLLGTALVAATFPLTFTNSWAHPDHVAVLLLFTACAWAIARGQTVATFILLALATLNRETAAFLVLLYLFAGAFTRTRLAVTALLGVEWAAVYVGLRLWRGFAPYEYWQAGRNLEFLRLMGPNYDPYYRAFAYFAIVLFGGLVAIALVGAREPRPLFATGALWVVPLFVVVAFTMSSIVEARIFTPLYTLVVPAVMFTCAAAEISYKSASLDESDV